MLRAALRKSNVVKFINFSSQLQSYKPYSVHQSPESEHRTTQLVTSLLKCSDNQKWKRVASMPPVFHKLTPSVIRSIIDEGRVDVDVCRLRRFFHWCEDEIGIQHELSSFSILAVALCNAGEYEGCRALVRRMVAICGSNLIVLGALVKCFRESEGSDGTVFDILVDVYREKCRLEDACNVFLASNVAGHEPDMVYVNLLLRDLLKDKMIDEFWSVCDGMVEAGIEPDVCAYNSMVEARLGCGEVDLAKSVLHEMERSGCGEASVGAYNLVIVALCEIEKVDEAIQLGKVMVAKGLYLDVSTVKSLVDGFQRNKRTGDVASVLSQIKEMGLYLDAVAYNDIIDRLFKQGNFTQAFKVWYEMHAGDVLLNVTLFHTILSGVCKANKTNRVAEIANQMIVRGMQPDYYTRYMLTRDCLAKKDLGKAIERTLSSYSLKFSKLSRSSNLGLLRDHIFIVTKCKGQSLDGGNCL